MPRYNQLKGFQFAPLTPKLFVNDQSSCTKMPTRYQSRPTGYPPPPKQMGQQNFPFFQFFWGAGTSRNAKGGLFETAAGPSCLILPGLFSAHSADFFVRITHCRDWFGICFQWLWSSSSSLCRSLFIFFLVFLVLDSFSFFLVFLVFLVFFWGGKGAEGE